MARDFGTYDVIIIGAGTAGCLLANRLSADGRTRVALLEAGRDDDYVWIRVPVGYLYCIGNPRTDWCFKTEAEPGLNGRAIAYPRGKVLGGCSSINGMIYMRGQREDYDGWRDGDGHGANPGWGWDEVLPYFLRHEDYQGGASEWHAAGNEWPVSKQRLRWDILDAFRDAAAQQGIPNNDDFNRGSNFGCGYFDVNQRRGARCNAAQAFLRPAASRGNLRVFSETHVLGLEFDGLRCTGVSVRRQRTLGSLHATREVILASGAVASPQLLMLAGIGDPAQLRAHGVDVRHALPGVGANLQDHLQLRMAFKVNGVKTLNTMAANWWGKAAMGFEYLRHRTGPLTMSPSQLGAFAHSAPDVPRPNVEYHVQPLSLDKFGDPLHRFNAFTASVCNLRPTSRGSVGLRSAAPEAAPRIAPNYLATDADRRVAVDALRLTRRIVGSPALARYQPVEFLPGAESQSEDELVKAAGAIGTTIFHPVGTCKMGPAADPHAVVDAQLCVHGVAGLRVIDASVMPTITSGNTNAPTLMIAERGAELVRQALRT